MPAKPVFHRAPLMPNRLAPLPLTALSPAGWLRDQLRVAADALTDTLSPLWPGLRGGPDEAAWTAQSWAARLPWVEALLSLGHLLADDVLVRAAHAHIAWGLAAQAQDGGFPLPEAEEWTGLAAWLRVLTLYYAVSADKDVPARMLLACKRQWTQLEARPLDARSAARVGDLLDPVLWLYNLTGKTVLLKLAHALRAQGMDWTAYCHTAPFKVALARELPWAKLRPRLMDEGSAPDGPHARLYWQAHAATVAAGLKTPALVAQWMGGIKHTEAFDAGYAALMRAHGAPNGLFSGDPLLAGASPAQGVSSAAIGELTHTLAVLLATLGEPAHADILERVAFNALPAAFSPDMRAHQRLQQVNQVSLRAAPRAWYADLPDANQFLPDGDDPDAPALHSAWPGFAAVQCMAARDGGLALLSYAPCRVRYRAGGVAVRLDVASAYPWDGAVRIRVGLRQAAAFALHLRVPGWAGGATVTVAGQTQDARSGTFVTLSRTWQDGDEVALCLPMAPETQPGYHGAVAVTCGALLYALAPARADADAQEDWPLKDAGGEEAPWAWALLPERGIIAEGTAQAASFTAPATCWLAAQAVPLPAWGMRRHSADAPPIAPRVDAAKARTVRLVPYGGTALRVALFPVGEDGARA